MLLNQIIPDVAALSAFVQRSLEGAAATQATVIACAEVASR